MWNHLSENGMATNRDPLTGGIIDSAIVSGEWFIIFNHPDLEAIEGLKSKAEAFEVHARELAKIGIIV